MARKLTRDVTIRDGRKFPQGTEVNVSFLDGKPTLCRITVAGSDDSWVTRIAGLSTTVSGFRNPSEATLEKWVGDSICPTPTGHRVEPDGYGPDGSPSWLLALGLI